MHTAQIGTFTDRNGVVQILQDPVTIQVASDHESANIEYELTPVPGGVFAESYKENPVPLLTTCEEAVNPCGTRYDPTTNEIIPFSNGFCMECSTIPQSDPYRELFERICTAASATSLVKCLYPSKYEYQAFSVNPIGVMNYDVTVSVDKNHVTLNSQTTTSVSGTHFVVSVVNTEPYELHDTLWDYETLFVPITPSDPHFQKHSTLAAHQQCRDRPIRRCLQQNWRFI